MEAEWRISGKEIIMLHRLQVDLWPACLALFVERQLAREGSITWKVNGTCQVHCHMLVLAAFP